MRTLSIALMLLVLTSKCNMNLEKLQIRKLDLIGEEEVRPSISSKLSDKERKKYEDVLDTKISFSKSISFMPKSFEPELKSYWDKNNKLIVVFSLIALIPLLFVFVYFVVRFVFKKCKGPTKIRDVSRAYRYYTWILFIVSSICTIALMITITTFSEKTK